MFRLVFIVILMLVFSKESWSVAIFARNPSIVIVGSGAAGIAAATKLLKNNFTNIVVLEAENRIGGRIHSVEFGDAYVDLGAEFCHGEMDNVVYSLVKDLGVLRHSQEEISFLFKGFRGKSTFILSNGEILKGEIVEKIAELSESIDSDEYCENVESVGECLPLKLEQMLPSIKNPKEKEILTLSTEWIFNFLATEDPTFDMNDLRLDSDYKLCEGDQAINWNGFGYKTILEVMMQKFPNKENQLPIDDKILLRKEVKRISRWKNGDRVKLTTLDGNTYRADHVILTPSVGVLKANHIHLFDPPLPREKIEAIENIGFGAVIKVLLHYPKRWWKDDSNWPLIWTNEDKKVLKKKKLEWLASTAGIVPAPKNPNVLIAWYAGSHIPLMTKLSQEEILRGQKYLIQKFCAPFYNVTNPDKIIRTTWYSNPHFQGSYSYESVKGHSKGGRKFPDTLAKPLLNRFNRPTVLFAGEATHTYYYATVHGAIETGYREAQRLIDLYRKKVEVKCIG